MLADVISAAPREKVVRLAVSILMNLAFRSNNLDGKSNSLELSTAGKQSNLLSDHSCLKEMIGSKILKAVNLLNDKRFDDPEMVEGARSSFMLFCLLFTCSLAKSFLNFSFFHTVIT